LRTLAERDLPSPRYASCALAREFDICSMLRFQYGYWAGRNWGNAWSCGKITETFGIDCTQASHGRVCHYALIDL
jgi:hypothetical protein